MGSAISFTTGRLLQKLKSSLSIDRADSADARMLTQEP